MKNNILSQVCLANISITDYWFFGAYAGLVITLAFCLLAAVKVKEMQRNQKPGREIKFNSPDDRTIGNEPDQKKVV